MRESGLAIVDRQTGESTDETFSSQTMSSSFPRIYTEEDSSDLNFEPAVAEWLRRNRSPQSDIGLHVDMAFDELLLNTPIEPLQESTGAEVSSLMKSNDEISPWKGELDAETTAGPSNPPRDQVHHEDNRNV